MTWPLASLIAFLLAASISDIRARIICPQILVAGVLVFLPWVSWWGVFGFVVGFGAAWAADLPGGDRWACAIVGGLVGPWIIGGALGLAYLGLLVALRSVGHRQSLVGHPFFPYVAGLVVMLQVLASLLEPLREPLIFH